MCCEVFFFVVALGGMRWEKGGDSWHWHWYWYLLSQHGYACVSVGGIVWGCAFGQFFGSLFYKRGLAVRAGE